MSPRAFCGLIFRCMANMSLVDIPDSLILGFWFCEWHEEPFHIVLIRSFSSRLSFHFLCCIGLRRFLEGRSEFPDPPDRCQMPSRGPSMWRLAAALLAFYAIIVCCLHDGLSHDAKFSFIASHDVSCDVQLVKVMA